MRIHEKDPTPMVTDAPAPTPSLSNTLVNETDTIPGASWLDIKQIQCMH